MMESLSFRTAIIETNKVRGQASFTQFIRRAKKPAARHPARGPCGALGLAFALLAVSLSLLTDNYYFDAVGTAMIGLLLVVVAAILAIETRAFCSASRRHARRRAGSSQRSPRPSASRGSST